MNIEDRENSVELLRHLLGTLDLSDIENIKGEELSDDSYYGRAADAEIFYRNNFEKVLKLLVQRQLEWIGTQTENIEQLMFGRGTINGLLLIQNWFEEQSNILKQKREEEKPKKTIYGIK